MPFKLSTTIGKIQNIPNPKNIEIINEFLEYMRNNGSSEHHQNNNLKVVISFGNFIGKDKSFFEITKHNEIIFEVDFVNDRVQEIHTKFNGDPESWGWNDNINEELSKVKPISKIVIRDEQDIYNILTNREKIEELLKEYQNNQLEEQQICCGENNPCVPKDLDVDYSSKRKEISLTTDTTTESLAATGKKQQQLQQQVRQQVKDELHKGENRHSNKIKEQKDLGNETLKPNLKAQIKEELEQSDKEQQILLKQNKQYVIDFLIDNKDSIRVEDLKIYEPIYKCYREKGNCNICNALTNIICISCNNDNK